MKKCSCGRELSAGQTVHFECWKRQFDARMRKTDKAMVKKAYSPVVSPVRVEKLKVYA